jgi:glutathione S-transferase
MTTPALMLYFAPGASSMAPHVALHEIGVPFEGQPVSLAKRETRTPAFLAINPEGQVPTLLVDGRPLTEVAGILFYLARRFPEAGLLPHGDVEAEAHVVSFEEHPALLLARHPALRLARDPVATREVARVLARLAALDGELSAARWLADFAAEESRSR